MMPHARAARARLRPHAAATAQRCSRCAAQELCKHPDGPPDACAKGRLDRERRAGEVQQLARVELPSRDPGRGDRLPSWFADAVAAASHLLSGHDFGRGKQPVGAQAAFFPDTTAAGAPPDRTGCAQPCHATDKVVETAGGSTNCTRCRAAPRNASNRCREPGNERGRFHQRRGFSGAAARCPTLPLRSRSARIRYALCTWHPFGRSHEPGHRRGDTHDPTGVWRQR